MRPVYVPRCASTPAAAAAPIATLPSSSSRSESQRSIMRDAHTARVERSMRASMRSANVRARAYARMEDRPERVSEKKEWSGPRASWSSRLSCSAAERYRACVRAYASARGMAAGTTAGTTAAITAHVDMSEKTEKSATSTALGSVSSSLFMSVAKRETTRPSGVVSKKAMLPCITTSASCSCSRLDARSPVNVNASVRRKVSSESETPSATKTAR
mmetsp:Transcript_22488/g.57859  ORF Transcript_22488/g.57859 Transcript_22488/m.57859 type:complete len:216 (-) Transcript_22488:96-743(-)